MSVNNIENLKNKYNNLLSKNLKSNSLIEISKGFSSNEGSIKDLIFDNTNSIKRSFEEEINHNDKQLKNEGIVIENILSLLVNPTNIASSLKCLNNISSSSRTESHLYEVMKGVNKVSKPIKKLFSSFI